MHLVVITSTANMGGAEISLIELLRRIHRDTRVSAVFPRDGEFRGYCEKAGVGVHIVQWPKTLSEVNETSVSSLFRVSPVLDVLKTVRALRACLRRINADVVITNGLKAHLMGAAACRSEYPLLWYLREGLDRRTNSGFLFGMLSRYCRGAIAISDYVKDSWSKVIGKKPVTVIYNIVDTPAFEDAADPEDLVKRPGEIWFSVIGALTPIKGHDLFIEAASLMRLPDARFLIAGTNFYASESRKFEDSLKQLVAQLDLCEQVRFLGFRRDIPSLLKLTDVVVQPNRGPEGLGRAVLEAMAAGVPVVSVDQWGPAEIVKQAGSGLLFKAGDGKALSEQMHRLAADPALRKQLGDAGRAWVKEHLIPGKLVQKFEEFIELIGRPKGSLP